MSFPFRALAFALVAVVLTACSSLSSERPDLARLYEADTMNPKQPPVIVIHGLMGSTLVERHGKEYWPGGLGALAFSDYRELARLDAAEQAVGSLRPGELMYGVATTDYYRALIDTLEDVGRFRRAKPGEPVDADDEDDRRRYYVMLYDWRKENLVAVRQLHNLIDAIRADYGDPDLPVDIVAHSNGGLIASYYLRYGPKDVMSDGVYEPWDLGGQRIRRMVLLGTPSLGAVTSIERLQRGFKLALRTVPVEVLTTFATPFESLPHPDAKVVYTPDGKPADFDIYDADAWRVRRWSVFSEEVEARVLAAASDRETGALEMAELQAHFVRHLGRARRFQEALGAPIRGNGVEVAVFGGDCAPTPGRAILDVGPDGRQRLVVRPEEVHSRVDGVDYERLLMLPGDGLVTRDSMMGRDLPEVFGRPSGVYPIAQSFLLCEKHGQLTVNPYFQNNLLHFLLAR